jgi:hexosaminidase
MVVPERSQGRAQVHPLKAQSMDVPPPLKALGLLLAIALPGHSGALEPALIPQPTRLEKRAGALTLRGPVTVACAVKGAEARAVAELLCTAIASDLGEPAMRTTHRDRASFLLSIRPGAAGDESYRLDITPQQARLMAATPAGLFYGVQTLRQLLFQGRDSKALPCLSIQDQPRFPWRGMHLDVSRHFFPVPVIKRYLDVLALHKMNVFHWHLTDDHGWHLEIRRYPRLTRVGAWREPKDGNEWIYATERSMDPAKRTCGGFYTQAEVREVVRYAATRHIRVVPEIDVPGHSMAALDAYPELSCTGMPFVPPKVVNEQTEFTDPFCAGNEATFRFLENVLLEVMALFPDPDLHLGADEVRKSSWRVCPKCQARMHALGLKDEEALQGWFMQRLARFLASHHRRAVGWDEMAQGGLPKGSLMMHWRTWLGDAAVIQAARTGHDVVRTSMDDLYFFPLEDSKSTGTAGSGPSNHLTRILRYQPIPAGLSKAEARRIKGVEGCIWTETVSTEADVMRALLPSLCALSEVAWSESPGAATFGERLPELRRFLAARGLAVQP